MPSNTYPNLKITYWDMRGRAETARLTMVVGKIPFEDERLSAAQWKELRPHTPFLSLPLLTVDGEVMTQSNAMVRYLGKLSGLYPTDPMTAFKVDEVLETTSDLLMSVYNYRGNDKEKLKEAREKLVKEDVPRYWGGLEKKLEKYGKGGWAVGEEVTVADLTICWVYYHFKCGILDYVPRDLLDSYPRARGVFDAVNELPEIAEWYKKYPVKFF